MFHKHFLIKTISSLIVISFFYLLYTTNILADPLPQNDGVNIGWWFRTEESSDLSIDHGIANKSHLNSIGSLISTILPNVFVVAGLIIFFFIVLGGFTMITNAGNPDKQKEGSQMLTGALIGFAIIFGAYWLVQLVGLILMGNAQALLDPTGWY